MVSILFWLPFPLRYVCGMGFSSPFLWSYTNYYVMLWGFVGIMWCWISVNSSLCLLDHPILSLRSPCPLTPVHICSYPLFHHCFLTFSISFITMSIKLSLFLYTSRFPFFFLIPFPFPSFSPSTLLLSSYPSYDNLLASTIESHRIKQVSVVHIPYYQTRASSLRDRICWRIF